MPINTNDWMNPEDPLVTVLDSGIKLTYPKHLEGGCFWLKDEFIKVIEKINRTTYDNCFEWCSGLGGIGFEILGKKLCRHVTFSDYYDLAITNCLENAQVNNIFNQVSGYISSTIKDIPNTRLWDLVIGTPPHCFNGEEYLDYLNKSNKEFTGSLSASNWARLTIDDGMEIHKEFFENIRTRVTDDADILIFGSTELPQIINLSSKGKLEIKKIYPVQRYGIIYHFKPI